jgi:hypothetical protein
VSGLRIRSGRTGFRHIQKCQEQGVAMSFDTAVNEVVDFSEFTIAEIESVDLPDTVGLPAMGASHASIGCCSCCSSSS